MESSFNVGDEQFTGTADSRNDSLVTLRRGLVFSLLYIQTCIARSGRAGSFPARPFLAANLCHQPYQVAALTKPARMHNVWYSFLCLFRMAGEARVAAGARQEGFIRRYRQRRGGRPHGRGRRGRRGICNEGGCKKALLIARDGRKSFMPYTQHQGYVPKVKSTGFETRQLPCLRGQNIAVFIIDVQGWTARQSWDGQAVGAGGEGDLVKAGMEGKGKSGSAAPAVVSNVLSEGGEEGQNMADDDEVGQVGISTFFVVEKTIRTRAPGKRGIRRTMPISACILPLRLMSRRAAFASGSPPLCELNPRKCGGDARPYAPFCEH